MSSALFTSIGVKTFLNNSEMKYRIEVVKTFLNNSVKTFHAELVPPIVRHIRQVTFVRHLGGVLSCPRGHFSCLTFFLLLFLAYANHFGDF